MTILLLKTARNARGSRRARTFYEQWAWQARRCFYCDVETWINKGILRVPPELRATEATREHLIRRADGGLDTIDNVVMACQACNTSRGETPWEEYLDQKESLSRLNCRNPEDGYGMTLIPTSKTPDFRKQDTYFMEGKHNIKRARQAR